METSNDVEIITVPAIVAKGAAHLAKVARHKNPQGFIDSDKDWTIVVEIYKVWKSIYPQHHAEFVSNNRALRGANDLKKGIAKEGSAMIQHQLEIPEKLHLMIQQIYPNQNYDRSFVEGLTNHLPEFNVSKV